MEANGKLFLIGVYPGNVSIPSEVVTTPNIWFLFQLDCLISEIPTKLTFEVQFPGEEPRINVVEVVKPELKPEHTRWMFRHGFGTAMQVLRPGKIRARITADETELDVSTPWIELGPIAPSVSEPPSEQSPSAEQATSPPP